MSSFLVKDVRIFDGETTVEKGSVLVEDGKISKVSSSPIQYDGLTFSKPGHTLLPGLIDAHIHADQGNTTALPQSLKFGVTTVCDMGNEWENIQKLLKQIQGGDCADLKYASFPATVENGWPTPIILMHSNDEETLAAVATYPKLVTPEDGRKYVHDRRKENVNYIKLMHESGTFMGAKFNMPSIELQKAIVEEAHKNGIKVVAHANTLGDTIDILGADIDGLAHTFFDQAPNEEVIATYKKNNAWCVPTLCALGSATTEGKETQEKFAHDPRVQHLLSEKSRQMMCLCMGMASKLQVENGYESVRQLKKAGIDVIMGTDSAGPAVGTAWGLSTHQELSLFVNKCGFTPEEALRSATSVTSRRFGYPDRGQIKEGLRADLMLVEGNPLEDIDNSLNLRGVWAAGQLCSAYEGKL